MMGVASRRNAEKLIKEGQVRVENQVIKNVATRIFPYGTQIAVNNRNYRPLHAWQWKPRLWIHYKMPRILVSHTPDDSKREILFPVLERMLSHDPDAQHLLSVGRLDYLSEGILLITNDGSLARHLELPENNYLRKYEMRIHGHLTDSKLKAISKGVKIDGVLYSGVDVRILKSSGPNHLVQASLTEGKNRELRNIFAHFNWRVSRLKRIQYGPYKLQDVPKGGLLEVPLKGKLLQWYEERRKTLIEYELLKSGKQNEEKN